jgi:hypothetical protein
MTSIFVLGVVDSVLVSELVAALLADMVGQNDMLLEWEEGRRRAERCREEAARCRPS